MTTNDVVRRARRLGGRAARRVVPTSTRQRWCHDQRQANRAVVPILVPSRVALLRSRRELSRSIVATAIANARAEYVASVHGATVDGKPHNFGPVAESACARLYPALRELRSAVVVETGVCNGVSTAIILMALENNGRGHLHSIDFPEIADGEARDETFWPGKGGAAIPAGKEPGWLVADALRARVDPVPRALARPVGWGAGRCRPYRRARQRALLRVHDLRVRGRLPRATRGACWHRTTPTGTTRSATSPRR